MAARSVDDGSRPHGRMGLVVAGLGATQIVGYGTLYYSYSILAPGMAAELAWSQQWVFGILSVALLTGALLAPVAGHWADRHGAGRLMAAGSIAAALALALCAVAPGRLGFAIGILAMELAACFVLYSTAFVAIVQVGGRDAQRSIVHLTLIAGFASTLFWPLTSFLVQHLSWRQVLMVFAGLNLLVCLPIHLWLASQARGTAVLSRRPPSIVDTLPSGRTPRPPIFWLMLAGFALEGFVLAAILVHMVPLTAALGLGAAGVFIASLFGPSQVGSRLLNMLFGARLRQTWLCLVATIALALGLCVLLLTAPSVSGAIVFVILFGFGSGLLSIVTGTLPLELFGRDGYGASVGWITAARQLSAAFAPFGLTFMMQGVGILPALWINAGVGLIGIAAFGAIALMQRRAAKGVTTTPVAVSKAEII